MDYDYSKISELEKSYLPSGFQGNVYNLSYKWEAVIPATDKPLKVLEIGSYHGANACSLVKTFCKHPKSEIHCLDPWADYDAYSEYKNLQPSNYGIFLSNISKLRFPELTKVHVHRMSSADMGSTFSDNYFDIIYIDGNHSTFYVLQDAEVSYAVKIFISVAKEYISLDIKTHSCQAFIRKL
jgi:hypothetical protein